MVSDSSVMAVIRAYRPSFRNDNDKVAFAVHAAFLTSGYALTATGKNAFSDPPSSGEEEVGIEGWNEFEDSYGFVYVKMEKSVKKKVVVKCLVIEDVLAIDAVNLGDDSKEPCHLQLNVKEYVSDSTVSTGNYGELYKNFEGLVDGLNSEILDNLERPPTKVGTSSSSARQGSPQDFSAPSIGGPVEPQPYSPDIVYPPIIPSGFDDIGPGFGAGVFPSRGSGSGGSMLVGPNDPRWFGRGPSGPPGGPGGIPGVPPGARFDPYGPPDIPGFEPSRFVRQPRPPGGIHPDLQHFQGPDYI